MIVVINYKEVLKMNELTKAYDKLKKECDNVGKAHNLTLFQNVSDNVLTIIRSIKVSSKEKELIWDLYHNYLYFEYKEI